MLVENNSRNYEQAFSQNRRCYGSVLFKNTKAQALKHSHIMEI